MDEKQRKVAQFWARLASIPSLDELREGERMRLVEAMQETLLPWLDDPDALEAYISSLAPSEQTVAREDCATGRIKEKLFNVLFFLHRKADELINPFFVGAPVFVPMGHLPQLVWTLDLKEGRLHERRENPGLERPLFIYDLRFRLEAELIDLIRSHKSAFPFRLCLACGDKFVPVKRQRYCSPNCAYRGGEAGRKEKRREYMREYMAKRRKKPKSV